MRPPAGTPRLAPTGADRDDRRVRRVTRADVARLAGVSTASVTYALDGASTKVSTATRARVLEAAATLGYRPNLAARALKMGSTAQLGLVVPGVLNRFFAEVTDQAEQAAADRGLALLVASARRGVATAIGQLAARQVDGVVLAVGHDAGDLDPLAAAGIPAATLNFRLDGVPGVGVDRYEGGRTAVGHLIEHGHERIGFVGPAVPGRRHSAWQDALDAAGLTPGPLLGTDFSREQGYRAGVELASMADRPTAVFISSDEQAIGVLLALHEAGVRVPEDLAIVGFDGSEEGAYSWPPLTTVAQPLARMVGLAVDRVVGSERGYVEVSSTLVVRRSCGCHPGADGGSEK